MGAVSRPLIVSCPIRRDGAPQSSETEPFLRESLRSHWLLCGAEMRSNVLIFMALVGSFPRYRLRRFRSPNRTQSGTPLAQVAARALPCIPGSPPS